MGQLMQFDLGWAGVGAGAAEPGRATGRPAGRRDQRPRPPTAGSPRTRSTGWPPKLPGAGPGRPRLVLGRGV